MEKDRLCCQNCVTTVYRVSCFKKHVHSKAHQQKMRELFQKETHILHTSVQNGYIPSIAVLEPFVKTEMKHHIIGLSLLTFCFSPDKSSSFYLCHVCEEKLPPDKILNHLSSGDHCSNFFNFTDPNVLSFSWIPSMDMRAILKPQITQEYEAKGCGTLQMLDLPDKILTKLENSIYSEVMNTLNENDKLLKHFEATQPKRTLIEAYQKDSNRKHPLLGLQHLVECTCDGPPEKRYYLCTLCGLTLAPHIIIKHVLSFDHIFCYFKAWHPSSLMSKECYDYTEYFTCMIQDFAKQTENIHGNPDMKTMRLKPAEFSSVNFSCFAEALKKLECIRKETTGGSLITSIKPGKKLEYQPVKARSVLVLPKLRCQNCNVTFETLFQYKEHLFQWKHKQMLKKLFGEDEGCNQTVSCSPHLGLYRCFQDGQKQNQPVIGMSLVVVCVCTQVQTETLYVCIGCKDSFPESVLRKHLNSQKHLIKTVLHYNPWLLHFCWEGQVDMTSLKSSACEEEKGRDPSERVLKVFDIPYWKFTSLIPPSYPKVIERLKKYETILKKGVPHCETYRKLRQNERFPILGRSFLVMYVISIRGHEEVAFLCLLCEKKLSDAECYAHDFSKEHVTKFLNSFYPGSLTPSTDAETLLDLATQAACDQGASHLQKIELDTPIREPCSYNRTIAILACAKRKRRGGPLEPTIRPKAKLCPRKSLKKVDKDNRRNNSEESSTTMEGSEKKTGQKSTDNKESVSKTNGAFDETSMSSYKEEQTREFLPETSLEKINNQDKKSRDEMPESCQDTEVSKSFKNVVKSLKGNTCKEDERKRPLSMSEKPQDATGSDEDVGKGVGCKRQRLTSKKYTSWEDSKINPSSGLKEVSTINNGESGKPNHKGVKDKASSGLQLVDSSVSVHTQYEVCSKMDSVQVVVIDDDSESSDTQQCSEPQPMTVMTETTSTKHPRPSNANIKRSNLKIPESATKPNTFLSVARKRKLPEKISRACVVVIDDDSESSDTQQCSEPQPMTVMTETTSTKTVAPKCQTAKRVTFHFGNTANTTKGAIGGTNVAKTLVKGENAEASDVAPFIQKSMPAAQQLMTAKSVNSEHKKPRTEPSHNPTTKPKANENIPKVGLNYLITVTCDGKKQVYCTLCSIKMKESGHLVHFTHKYNYVKLKYPQWTVKLPEEESKLDKIVTHLAEVEKDIGSQMNESIEVSSKEYQALHTFPDNEALEKVKKMVRQKNFQMSSSSSTDLRRQRNLANPDDEMKSNLKEKADDAIPDLSQISSLKNNHDPIPIRGLHNEHTAVEKEQLEPDIEAQAPQSLSPSTMKCQTGQKNVDAQAHVEVTPAVQSPVQGYADPVATQSDSFATFIQSPHLCQEPAGKRQQQEKSNLEIQETEQTPPASVLSSSPDSLSSGFLVSRAESTKQQNLSTSHALENVPKHSEDSPVPVPGQHSVSPAFPTISVGGRSQANLSRYLDVKGLSAEPIIGLSKVWECQGKSEMSFFLCESCTKTIPLKHICQHMISSEHQFEYIRKQYPKYLSFWEEENLSLDEKRENLKSVAQFLSQQEGQNKTNAQGVMLAKELYESVQKAPFSEALRMVQKINKGDKVRVMYLPTITLQQREKLSEKQSQKESLPVEPPATDQKSDNGSGEKTEKYHVERDTAMAADLIGVQQRAMLSPVEVGNTLSKTDTIVLPSSGTGTCLTPQENCRSPVMQPELQHQRPATELQMTGTEVHKLQSFCQPTFHPCIQPVSTKDKILSFRKRPADTSAETQVRTWTDNPQLKKPFPVKYTQSSLEQDSHTSPAIACESASVSPATTPTTVSQKDKDKCPGIDEENESVVEHTQLVHLLAQMREDRSEMSLASCKSIQDDAESSNSYASQSSKSGAGKNWDSSIANYQKCDSKSQHMKSTVKSVSPMLASASSADHGELQDNVNQLKSNVNNPEAPSHDTGQGQGSTQTDATGAFQQPIEPIITDRSKSQNHQLMDSCKGQGPTEGTRNIEGVCGFSMVETANPCNIHSAPGGYGQYSQILTNGTSGQLYFKPVPGYLGQDSIRANNGILFQRSSAGLYPSQIYPQQEAIPLSGPPGYRPDLVTPILSEWAHLQQQHHPSLNQVQQCSSRSSVNLAAGHVEVYNDAANRGDVVFITPAINSQGLIDQTKSTMQITVPMQNSNNMSANAHPYFGPPAFHPTAYTMYTAYNKAILQTSTDGVFAPGFTIAPSVANATPPSSHENSC